VLLLLKKEGGIAKYAFAVVLGGKIFMPSFMRIGSCIQYQGYNLNNLRDYNISESMKNTTEMASGGMIHSHA
jgi:hypothetical protein